MTKDKGIDNELIDNLLKDYKKPQDLIGDNGLLKQLTKQLLERAMAAELTEHVGYAKHDPGGHHSGNSRNGKSAKTIKGSFGDLSLETPRDRNGTFERRSSKSIRRALRALKKWTMPVTTGRKRSTASASSTKIDCRRTKPKGQRRNETAKTKPGHGNDGKTNYVFPPFPQPLLLLTNYDKKQRTKNNHDRLHKIACASVFVVTASHDAKSERWKFPLSTVSTFIP
jgi:Transposase, Mutator family